VKPSWCLAAAIACATAVAAVSPAGAAPAKSELRRDDPPSWVHPETWTESSAPSNSSGYVDRLLDYQVNIDTQEIYCHVVYAITSTSTLSDGSTIRIEFDPSYQSVTLHTATRWRNGSALAEAGADFKEIQREQSLEEAVYLGEETWLAFLKDVQVGDTIELAYTIRGFNPVFQGRYCDSFRLQGSSPVQRTSLRVVYGGARNPLFKATNTPEDGKMSSIGGSREYAITLKDLPAIVYEDALPVGFQPGARVDISEFATWSDVASWGAGLFAAPAEDGVGAKVGEILASAAADTAEKRALAILRYVQDDVRSLGMETGINSHQPHSPAEVLANRFGDCKDKVALFVSMMRSAGLTAWPVLAHTWRQDLVKDDIPSPLAFNHVIAAIDWRGSVVYVDPTRSHQGGGLTQRAISDFGWGLPVRQDARALVDLPSPRGYTTRKIETFHVADLNGPAELSVRYIYAGEGADGIRGRLADKGLDGVRDDITEAMRDQYGEVALTGGPAVKDDRDGNTIELTIQYRVTRLLTTEGSRVQFELYPSIIEERLREPAVASRRTQPLYLEHPVTIIQEQVVELPSDWSIDAGTTTVDDPHFLASTSVSPSGTTVRIVSEFRSRSDRVEPADWERYLADLKESRQTIGWTIWNKAFAGTAAPPEASASGAVDDQQPTLDWASVGGAIVAAVAIFLAAALGMGSDW
jgi:hypothetical protein